MFEGEYVERYHDIPETTNTLPIEQRVGVRNNIKNHSPFALGLLFKSIVKSNQDFDTYLDTYYV